MNTVTFEESSDREIELSATKDLSNDFLSQEEINYYFNLEELSLTTTGMTFIKNPQQNQ